METSSLFNFFIQTIQGQGIMIQFAWMLIAFYGIYKWSSYKEKELKKDADTEFSKNIYQKILSTANPEIESYIKKIAEKKFTEKTQS